MTDAELVAALVLRELDLSHSEQLRLSTWRGLVARGERLTHRERKAAEAMLRRVTG